MGCDIHVYVEHRPSTTYSWGGFGQMNPGRDYALFGTLAGVRGTVAPVVQPRGIPSDVGFWASDDYTLRVGEVTSWEGHTVSQADAERFLAHGSTWYRQEQGHRITHPDWHTPSWVTLPELREAMRRANAMHDGRQCDPEWDAVAAAMEALERRGHEVRLVFWFDN
jgi:hypothetical protein